MTVYEVIRRPIITEKSTLLREQDNKVVFQVAKEATKGDVKLAVEKLFNVKVTAVNTSVVPGKPKRFGRTFGRRSGWKKAIVTLAEGEELDFFDAVEEIEEEVEEDGAEE